MGKMRRAAKVLRVRTYPMSVGWPPREIMKREKNGIVILMENICTALVRVKTRTLPFIKSRFFTPYFLPR
jgi:hypothetical protein